MILTIKNRGLKMKEKIESVISAVFSLVEIICRIVLIFMVCTVTVQVIFRALGSNIKWCEEVMLILLDTMMFLLLPIGVKDDLHIRIEAFAKYFPRKFKVFLVYFSNVVLTIVSLCMIRYGFYLVEKTNSKFTITGLPRKYLYMITVISGVLCLVMTIAKFFGMFPTKSTEDFLNPPVTDESLS